MVVEEWNNITFLLQHTTTINCDNHHLFYCTLNQKMKERLFLRLFFTILISSSRFVQPFTIPNSPQQHGLKTRLHALDETKTVVVAGATGYIGRAVVRESLDKGYNTIALVRSLDKINSEEGQRLYGESFNGANVVEMDVSDAEALSNYLAGIENKVDRALIKPPASAGRCKVRILLARDGGVMNVTDIEGGSVCLSALRNAVYSAGIFPVPKNDEEVFQACFCQCHKVRRSPQE